MNASLNTTFHRDGTVTYWSVYNQRWIKNASFVPQRELDAMSYEERSQVIDHLAQPRQIEDEE